MTQNLDQALLADHTYDIAIIGAGIAGSYCAAQLSAAGLNVAILEKSRGTGGRASSRRIPAKHSGNSKEPSSIDTSCELGAPFFHGSDTNLQADINDWLSQKVIAEWPAADTKTSAGTTVKAYTGIPRMSALTRHLCAQIGNSHIYTGQRVTHIDRAVADHKLWYLRDDRYQVLMRARQLIITAPAAQSAQLLCSADTPQTFLLSAHQAMRCCSPQWAAIVTPLTDSASAALCDSNSVLEPQHPVLARAICDSAKPGRITQPERWVLQASPTWSKTYQDATPQWIGEQLLSAFQSLFLLPLDELAISNVHRWRLARHHSAANAVTESWLWDKDTNLGIAADWLSDGSVAGALLSAKFLSKQIISANK